MQDIRGQMVNWRFVDLGRRLDFLLAGMGWCRMPERLVAPHLAAGRLVPLIIADDPAGATGSLTIYAAHLRDRPLGRAGSWLLANLQAQFTSTTSATDQRKSRVFTRTTAPGSTPSA